MDLKNKVVDFWNRQSCGEALYLSGENRISYTLQSIKRYQLEPEILSFVDFGQCQGKQVLEIGVGLGADHQMLAEAGSLALYGIDITPRAVAHVKKRFELMGLQSNVEVGDAENLNYPDEIFDFIYSWRVLHHSPNTEKAVSEVFRVLKPGGLAKIMIYHKYSMVGIMLWIRYALMKGKIFKSLNDIYFHYLESPGTKAYSVKEVRQLFKDFKEVSIEIQLGHGDLLTSATGQRYRGIVLNIARVIWPRKILKTFFKNSGLTMMITAKKSL